MSKETYFSKAVEMDDGGWVKHTDYHWSRFVNGIRLDYWPSKSKYQYNGQVAIGDVYSFINKSNEI